MKRRNRPPSRISGLPGGGASARSWPDLGDEADQVPVEHDLGLQGRRALEAPDRLASAVELDADAVDVDSLVQQMRVDAAVAERIGDPSGSVLLHALNLPVVA
jgi:hypothetical protein